ncbi:MAG: transposase [Blastocatellia bacterium]
MKRSKFSEGQVLGILKAVEAGRTVAEVCRENGVSESTYFNWKSKHGGMTASEIKRLRELEEENAKLKRMYADVSLMNVALKDLIEKKGW